MKESFARSHDPHSESEWKVQKNLCRVFIKGSQIPIVTCMRMLLMSKSLSRDPTWWRRRSQQKAQENPQSLRPRWENQSPAPGNNNQSILGFKRNLSANGGLERPNAKEDTKVHVRLPLQVIDPDGDDEVWDDDDGWEHWWLDFVITSSWSIKTGQMVVNFTPDRCKDNYLYSR